MTRVGHSASPAAPLTTALEDGRPHHKPEHKQDHKGDEKARMNGGATKCSN